MGLLGGGLGVGPLGGGLGVGPLGGGLGVGPLSGGLGVGPLGGGLGVGPLGTEPGLAPLGGEPGVGPLGRDRTVRPLAGGCAVERPFSKPRATPGPPVVLGVDDGSEFVGGAVTELVSVGSGVTGGFPVTAGVLPAVFM